jgi:eukaryotic-like serine/threonine-protein kinase
MPRTVRDVRLNACLCEARVEATTSNISLSTLQNALAGRYAFERELGRGGMATVYLARDLTRDRYVAVKVLLPELAVTLGMERFLREIEVGTALQHPSIVGVLDSGSADGVLYYVMPFVEGMSLRDRLNKEKQLPVDDTIAITLQVADALAYAHSKGVIHRDIKPENILLDAKGAAMVADFGIARAVSVAGGETLTRTGMAVGTPTYMSPEQAMGSKDVTPESDIYSLACVVYELLAGQPPFTGPTAMALLARHSLDNVPSLKIVRGTVPDAVEDAIVRAMAKVPADRFRSATDFAAAMTDHAGAARRRQDSIRAKAIAANTVEGPALGSGRKKTAMIAAAVAVPLLAAGGWFGWKATQGSATPEGLEGDFAKKNIAVMYFQDRSPKKELAYLADGLTEALIDQLSEIPQLKVASRNGSAAFKGKEGVPTDSIARTLKVGTVVNGTVEAAGDGRVRVVVRLDDALTGAQIDKTQIEQQAGNTLALEDSIAVQVALFLRRRVGQDIQQIKSKIGTRNAAAWEALQRAKQSLAEVDALIRARDVPAALGKISAADSALAKVEAMDGNWRTPTIERGWLAFRAARLVGSTSPDFTKWMDAGLAHADRVLKKVPNDVDAMEVRGNFRYWQWLNNVAPNPTAAAALIASAEQDFRAATAGTSERASAWNSLSHLLNNKGQLSESKLAAERAYNADPFLTNVDLTIHRLFLASADLQIREEAEKWCGVGQARFPQNYRFTECKLWLYALPTQQKPNIDEVWKTYDEFVKVSPVNIQEFNKLKGKLMVGLAVLRAGLPDSAKALAEANQGDPQVDARNQLTFYASMIYSQAGDKDTAIDLLAKYLAANPQQRAFAANDKSWWLKDIRSDPRYKALVSGSN